MHTRSAIGIKCAALVTAMFWATNCDADTKAELADIRSIAIISAIGDSITFASVGVLNFKRGAHSLPVPDWNIDDQVEQEVGEKLEGRFNVSHVTYDRAAFAREISHALTLEEPPIKDLVSKLSAPVDAYLVISKRGTISTHQYLNLAGGINVLEQTSLLRKPVYALCILIQLQLFSAKTDEPIAQTEIVLKPSVRYDDPENQLDPALWPADGIHLTETQKSELRKRVAAKLTATVDDSLAPMGLE